MGFLLFVIIVFISALFVYIKTKDKSTTGNMNVEPIYEQVSDNPQPQQKDSVAQTHVQLGTKDIKLENNRCYGDIRAMKMTECSAYIHIPHYLNK